MVFAAIYAHGIQPYLAAKANGGFACPIVFYLILFAVVLVWDSAHYKNRQADANAANERGAGTGGRTKVNITKYRFLCAHGAHL